MGPEIWMRIPKWIDATRVELESRVNRWDDVNELIRDVVVAEHQGIDTSDDQPDQEVALRTLLSHELRRESPAAQGKADSDFYTQVSNRPITDTERTTPTYLKFLSQYVTKSQAVRAIRSMKANTSAPA